LIAVGIATLLISLLGGGIWLIRLNAQPQVVATNGADRWANDTSTTPATIPFSTQEAVQIAVDRAFTSYYQAHAGATLLGAPLTPAFPIAQGWIQIFAANALLLPGKHAAPTGKTDKQIDQLIQDGVEDNRTGVIELPLLQTLLTVGSGASVGGGLTYVDLRSTTNPNLMRPVPATTNTPRQSTSQGAFIQTGTSDGKLVGHTIPAALWAFINRRDISPDGWQTDFGAPLTEAIPFTDVQYGVSHRLLIQAFQQGALVMDRDVKNAAGQPLIQPLDTGVAYLQTLTPPTPAPVEHTPIWTSSDLDILNAPGTGQAILHVGQAFPLTLAGKSHWDAGTLWYQAQWKVPTSTGAGWMPASAITRTAPAAPSETWTPGNGTSATVPEETSAWASFNQLSPGLAQYLASQGDNTAAVVYDLTRNHYYAYHLDNQYLMGNAVKAPIVVAFLAMKEQQGIRPDAEEIDELTTMLTTTEARAEDDDASEAIYNEIGRAIGLKEYLNQIGITGLTPENDDLLYTLTNPLAMTQLLAMLYEGKILTQQDRSLVFSLLENTEPSYQVGVGDTSPQGATVAMQDGWVMGTDGRWAMNSSGIVTVGSETYLIAVDSAHVDSLAEGQDIARQVCTAVASLLA
jgi:hypothetical protein